MKMNVMARRSLENTCEVRGYRRPAPKNISYDSVLKSFILKK